MTDPGPLKVCVGFTEEDVERFCKGAKFTHETIRKWYGGNNLDGVRLYNSNSVRRALGEERLWNIWGQTGAYVVLAERVTKNASGFYDVIFGLTAKTRLAFPSFPTEKHSVISPVTEGDFLAVLIHDGFVSYSLKDGVIEIPIFPKSSRGHAEDEGEARRRSAREDILEALSLKKRKQISW